MADKQIRLLVDELRRMGESFAGQPFFPLALARWVNSLAMTDLADLSLTHFDQIVEGLGLLDRHFAIPANRQERLQRPHGEAALRELGRASQLVTSLQALPVDVLASNLDRVRKSVPMDPSLDLFYQLSEFSRYFSDLRVMAPSLRRLGEEFVRYDRRSFDEARFHRMLKQGLALEEALNAHVEQLGDNQSPLKYGSLQRARDLVISINGLLAAMERGDYGPLEMAIAQARDGAVVPVGAQTSSADAPVPSASTQETARGKVFIGHGHSPLWRELKDYIEDDLGLQTRYFEQTSRVGEHMAEILNGFLQDTVCAITLLTADDEQADGSERARQNVVHETGFFQGRLGFKQVAMVVQREVEEFSNVAGIIPIYFEGRHINQTFAEISRWLKREGLLS